MEYKELLKNQDQKTSTFERTPSWELQGLIFLSSVNPKKYTLHEVSEMEGMIGVYYLEDKDPGSQIGSTIYHNRVRNTFESSPVPYKDQG